MSTAVSRSVWERAQTGHLETWEKYAASGAPSSPSRGAGWRAILAEVEKQAPLGDGEAVLDIGCGLDSSLDFFERPIAGYTVDSLMGRLLRFGLSSRARHTAGMLERLPYRDASFDRVMLLNVLDHVQDAAGGLVEVERVLRPGGVLVLSVDTYRGRRYWSKRLDKWWTRTRGARTKHPLVFSDVSVHRLLLRHGFRPGPAAHVAGTKARRRLFVARRG